MGHAIQTFYSQMLLLQDTDKEIPIWENTIASHN